MSLQDNTYVYGLLAERLFTSFRTLRGDPTASVLRYTETGGSTPYGSEPTGSLVASLANLACAVSSPGATTATAADGTQVQLREGERLFMFLTSAVTLMVTDEIEYESMQWRALSGGPGRPLVVNDPCGLSWGVFTRVGP